VSRILSFFWAFCVFFGPDLGSNRVAFLGLFGPRFGAFPKGPDFGPKSPYFRGFWGLFDPKSLGFVSFS
jgi:hypothetical protein